MKKAAKQYQMREMSRNIFSLKTVNQFFTGKKKKKCVKILQFILHTTYICRSYITSILIYLLKQFPSHENLSLFY